MGQELDAKHIDWSQTRELRHGQCIGVMEISASFVRPMGIQILPRVTIRDRQENSMSDRTTARKISQKVHFSKGSIGNCFHPAHCRTATTLSNFSVPSSGARRASIVPVWRSTVMLTCLIAGRRNGNHRYLPADRFLRLGVSRGSRLAWSRENFLYPSRTHNP